MNTPIDQSATMYINSLPRIQSVRQKEQYCGDVLLLPLEAVVRIDNASNALLSGVCDLNDSKAKDILRIIELHNADNLQYTETAILSPSIYVHSLTDKPWHITTQCIIITHLSQNGADWVMAEDERMRIHYGKHEMDHFWLPCSRVLHQITETDPIYVLNRRISGWDGSTDRPVVELLGAGGHLQAVWNGETFVSRDLKDNLKKEFAEEVGLDIDKDDIQCVGGFANNKTHELVVLFCTFINELQLPKMQQHALKNLEEDTDGLYLGVFEDVIKQYKKNPQFFAGGYNAAPTNFPNNDQLMKKCFSMLK